MNVTKGNIAILNEKRSNDIHLIETLNNRLKTTEIKHEERETDTRNRSEKIERMERSPIYGRLNLEKLHNRKYF